MRVYCSSSYIILINLVWRHYYTLASLSIALFTAAVGPFSCRLQNYDLALATVNVS